MKEYHSRPTCLKAQGWEGAECEEFLTFKGARLDACDTDPSEAHPVQLQPAAARQGPDRFGDHKMNQTPV